MNPTNCKSCGSPLPEGATLCPACGKSIEETVSTAAPASDIPVAPVAPAPVSAPPATEPVPFPSPVADPAPSSFGAVPAPVQPAVPAPGQPVAPAPGFDAPPAPGQPVAPAPGLNGTPAPGQPMGTPPYDATQQAPYGAAPMAPGAPAPYGQPMQPGMPPYPGQAPFPVAKKFSGPAIASMVLGIVSLFLPYLFGIIAGAVAIILGITTLSKFNSTTQKGKAMAIVGLILGALTILILLFL